MWRLDEDHPLRLAAVEPASGEASPYILIRDRLEARILRSGLSTSWSNSAKQQRRAIRRMEQRSVLSPGAAGPRTLSAEEVAAGWPLRHRRACAAPGLAQATAGRARRPRPQSRTASRPPLVRRRCWCRWSTHPEGLTVLFTMRTPHLSAHAGQISFPGGRIDPGMPMRRAAALREAEEEVGLEPAQIRLLGRLDTYVTRTGFRVDPLVGLVAPPLDLKPDPHEVADIFEVSLDFLIDPANRRRDSRVFEGSERFFWAIPWRTATSGAPPRACW